MTKVEGLREHVRDAARVVNDVVRSKQSGNHHDPLCPGIDNLLQIVDVDSADAENWQTHFRVNTLDIGKTDWPVVGLRRRGEDRAEADVICAFALRGDGLFEAVGRFTDDDRTA